MIADLIVAVQAEYDAGRRGDAAPWLATCQALA